MKSPHRVIATILIGIFFSVTACRKRPYDFYVSGHIYKDCTMEPFANEPIALKGTDYNGFHKYYVSLQTVTDANGYFKFNGKAYGSLEDVRVENYSVSSISNETDDLEFFKSPSTSIIVNLNVLKPYSSADTLFITNYNDPQNNLKIAGPFSSMELYRADNYIFSGGGSNLNKSVSYRINDGKWQQSPFSIAICDTSRVAVTIN